MAPSRAAADEDRDTERLVARVHAGDDQAFADLYMRYFDRVYSYALVALGDPHAAEDTTQHVFANVLEALPRYQPSRAPFRGWLFSIVRNQTITELARRGRIEPLDAEELDRRREREAEPAADDLDALGWVTDKELVLLIERLPLAQRQVLMLRYMLDLPHAQVAAALGRSSDDVRQLQSRALAFLRDRLTALGHAPSRKRARITRVRRQAPVIRMRRWSLHGW